ncbi:MAG: pyruvate kinase [Bacteroidetes bacterium]|nr:pyruvate kinase [Bacteroidota bacterium]
MQSKQNNDFQLTKIIATLGPATGSVDKIISLINEGVRVFRINFSHGSFEEHEKTYSYIREAEKRTGIFVAIMGDLSGPKIRVGRVVEGGVLVVEDDCIVFVRDEIIAGSKGYELSFSSTLPEFITEVKIGEKILIDDGNIECECIELKTRNGKHELLCKVIIGGTISSSKGINLPHTNLSVSALTEKDKACVDFAVTHNFDFLALSFVRQAEDIRILKNLLTELGARPGKIITSGGDLGFSKLSSVRDSFIPIITKIEKPQAIDNLEAIIMETDAVMVARGDLGVEMDLAEVAILQKQIIKLCQEHGRPVIVATQMLQSMIESAVPTRAEVSDVANAIFDGADAVMLSGETAVGKYPVQVVRMMNKIAFRTNNYIKLNSIKAGTDMEKPDLSFRAAAIAKGVQTLVKEIDPKFIVVWTNMGGSAVYLSQHRMQVPILAFNAEESRLRQLSLLYGIMPIKMEQPKSGSDFINNIDQMLISKKWAELGDAIIIVSGDPINRKGFANRIVIHFVGESVD